MRDGRERSDDSVRMLHAQRQQRASWPQAGHVAVCDDECVGLQLRDLPQSGQSVFPAAQGS